MDSVIKNYSVIIDTMEEVYHTTRDDYGLRANGVLTALEKFEIFLALSFVIFFLDQQKR